ncbi:Aminotransferase [Macleaya cordata]|uniref:Aminotransferase n=1 Tax=Macleaya cordata TaxID=56857 RepID=A0A200Q181_MACCD|nr:Aminotransferase [Macleaya cordata]
MEMITSSWDLWVDEAISRLESLKLLRSLRPISLSTTTTQEEIMEEEAEESRLFDTFDELRSWDRSSVEVLIAEPTFQNWVHNLPSSGDDVMHRAGDLDVKLGARCQRFRKLLLFSGNDYLGLSSHPTVRKAAAEAALEHGMGPRGSALICGYTSHHRLLESCLADLKKKEDCLLCPTGFAANMALMVTLGSVSSLLASGRKPLKDEKVAIFSDALNHASIIDGIRLAERQKEVEIFVYRHCDMVHLNALLSSCTMRKKVVVSDGLFSMDGDFAPIVKLAELRKKHGFLLVIDDAHGTLVCGKNGGGVAEEYNCENDVDLCIGTLSKAAGCHGGFIACRKIKVKDLGTPNLEYWFTRVPKTGTKNPVRGTQGGVGFPVTMEYLIRYLVSCECQMNSKKWKQLLQSRGRSFIFSTALPVPIAAAAHGIADIQVDLNFSFEVPTKEIRIIVNYALEGVNINLAAAVVVAKKEKWRRRAIWRRVQDFRALTQIHITSPIISLVVGSEERALRASRHLLESGFHVTAIRPPTVPANSCRLRVTLSAAHTIDDLKKLTSALSLCINFSDISVVTNSSNGNGYYAKL